MSLFPTEFPPINRRIEGRPTIVADAGRDQRRRVESHRHTGTAVIDKEDMLASAGFVAKKADSAARIETLKSLPPHQFVTRTADGRTRYLYADPTACGCIYVGDQSAYD